MNEINMSLIANAGILVEYEQKKLIIDGLYRTEICGFSNLLPEQLEDIRTGSGKLGNADYLLFTHAHEDHFSAGLAAEFIKNGSDNEKYVFLPAGIRQKDSETIVIASEEAGNCRIVPCGKERSFLTLSYDIRLELLSMAHMGESYRDVQNNCLLLTLGKKEILFTGDAEPDYGVFQNYIGDRRISAVFVNPLFYHDPKGWKIIENLLKPDLAVVYHLAFPEQDKFRLAKMVLKDKTLREGMPFKTVLLNEEKQSVSL